MAGRQQDDLGALGRRRTDPVELRRQLRLGRPEVELGQRLERLAQQRARWPPTRPDSSSRIRPSSSSTADCASRQALPSSTTTSGSTNSVCPLPEASCTIPLTRPRASARIGHDVAPVAQGHDRLLERRAQLRPDERIEAPPQAVVGDAHGGPQRRPGGAMPCPAARPVGSKLRPSVLRRAGSGCSRRPSSRSSGRRSSARRRGQPRCRVEGLGDLEELRRVEPAATHRAADPGSMSWAAPIPTPGRSWSRARAWSVSSRPRATMTGSADGSSASASRREGSNEVVLGQPGAHGRELEQRDRSARPSGRVSACGPLSDGLTAPAAARARSPTAPRRRRCRSGAWPAISRRRLARPGAPRDGAATPGRTGRCPS